jgi:hypothetical protein
MFADHFDELDVQQVHRHLFLAHDKVLRVWRRMCAWNERGGGKIKRQKSKVKKSRRYKEVISSKNETET